MEVLQNCSAIFLNERIYFPKNPGHSYNHLQDTIVVHVLEDRDITKAIHHSLGTRLKPELLLYLLHLLYFFLPRLLQGCRKL